MKFLIVVRTIHKEIDTCIACGKKQNYKYGKTYCYNIFNVFFYTDLRK